MDNKQLIVIVVAIILVMITAIMARSAVLTERYEVNRQWIEELAKRGIVKPNTNGSFEWTKE